MNLETRLRSAAMRHFSAERYLQKQCTKARQARERAGNPPVVHYFHQVDDPYSHLAVQKWNALTSHYSIPFKPHLVDPPAAEFQGSSQHFSTWARLDAQSVASAYGTHFEPGIEAPSVDGVLRAQTILAQHLDKGDFADAAMQIGQALWAGDALRTTPDGASAKTALETGNALRKTLGHYQGGMFYFDGEWFWGIDRIRSLETRLAREGHSTNPDHICVPEPEGTHTSGLDCSGIVLEYFPSLRSPYTAVGHPSVVELIQRSGVELKLRPVMPMMMRGIPAPRPKQTYIITDAAREGRTRNNPLGRIVDPFGKPVMRAFALYPGAVAQGRGLEFVTAYLRASWFDGIDITKEKGLRQVAASAGLDWQALENSRTDSAWEAVLEDNLQIMLQENLWGVPSFRVTGGNKPDAFSCWGQDRVWRIEQEIAARAST